MYGGEGLVRPAKLRQLDSGELAVDLPGAICLWVGRGDRESAERRRRLRDVRGWGHGVRQIARAKLFFIFRLRVLDHFLFFFVVFFFFLFRDAFGVGGGVGVRIYSVGVAAVGISIYQLVWLPY